MKKRIADCVFVVYLAVLLRITVFRSSFSLEPAFTNVKIDLVPFDEIFVLLFTNPINYVILFFGNILWFIPHGFYLYYFRNQSVYMCVLYGFLLSLFIEAAQFIFGTGCTEVEDLILNTLGACIGILISVVIQKTGDKKKTRR